MKKRLFLFALIMGNIGSSFAYSPYGQAGWTYSNPQQKDYYQQHNNSQQNQRVDIYNQYNQYQGYTQKRNDNQVDVYNQYNQYQGSLKKN